MEMKRMEAEQRTMTLRIPNLGDRYGPSNGYRKGLKPTLKDEEKALREKHGIHKEALTGIRCKEHYHQKRYFEYRVPDGEEEKDGKKVPRYREIKLCWCDPAQVDELRKEKDREYGQIHTLPDTEEMRERIRGMLEAGYVLMVGDRIPGYGTIGEYSIIPDDVYDREHGTMSPVPEAPKGNGRTPPPPPPGGRK